MWFSSSAGNLHENAMWSSAEIGQVGCLVYTLFIFRDGVENIIKSSEKKMIDS